MTFVGKLSGQLDAVRDLIETNKVAIGVEEVRIGERRGYKSPACFVFQAPEGAPRGITSGHTGVEEYDAGVRIVVVTKKYQESDDQNVLKIIERILDTLDDNAPVGSARDMAVTNPGQVAPSAIDDRGVYETVGQADVSFPILIERR